MTGKYPISSLYCFILLDSPAKVRKISNISSSNDSGYNDKGEERSLQEITVRSCESLHGKLKKLVYFNHCQKGAYRENDQTVSKASKKDIYIYKSNLNP